MGKRQLIVVSSDSKFRVWVNIDITYVNFALMIVNIINFGFIKSNLSFVNFQVAFILILFLIFLFDELYALSTHFLLI